MQEQLSDLQKKLAKEEEEKTSVAKLNKELDKVQNLYSPYFHCTVFTLQDFPTFIEPICFSRS